MSQNAVGTKVSFLNKQSGFSLIELMTVVCIISILVSIAAPRFERLRNRARQAEAKVNLSALFKAEKAFFTEWGGYTGDFRDIGLGIQGRLVYDIGFGGTGWQPAFPFVPASSFLCGAGMAYNTEVSFCAIDVGSSQARVIFSPAPAVVGCSGGAVPSLTGFRATAIGALGAAIPDIWTMDERRSMCHNQYGE